MNLKDVALSLRMTEKSYYMNSSQKYVFEVNPKADKKDIKNALKDLFGVEVSSIWTINCRRKKRYKGAKRLMVKTKKIKKAIVELREGNKIDLLDDVFKSNDKK